MGDMQSEGAGGVLFMSLLLGFFVGPLCFFVLSFIYAGASEALLFFNVTTRIALDRQVYVSVPVGSYLCCLIYVAGNVCYEVAKAKAWLNYSKLINDVTSPISPRGRMP